MFYVVFLFCSILGIFEKSMKKEESTRGLLLLSQRFFAKKKL